MKTRKVLPGLVAGLLLVPTVAPAGGPPLPRDSRVPGGIAILDLGTAAKAPGAVYFGVYRAPVVHEGGAWKAVVGIPLATAPGRHVARLVTAAPDDADVEIRFDVAPKTYAEQRLTVEPRKVDPLPDDLKRIETESARTEQALSTYSEDMTPTWQWQPPVPGERSSSFGLRRVFNGQARNPHLSLIHI